MSMQTVEYQGYGLDLSRVVSAMAQSYPTAAEHIGELIDDGVDIMDAAGDVDVITPCNSDDFGCLLMIGSVVPVGNADIKVYSIPEAQSHLVEAACELVREGFGGGYTNQNDENNLAEYLTANANAFMGYSWDIGPFTDCI